MSGEAAGVAVGDGRGILAQPSGGRPWGLVSGRSIVARRDDAPPRMGMAPSMPPTGEVSPEAGSVEEHQEPLACAVALSHLRPRDRPTRADVWRPGAQPRTAWSTRKSISTTAGGRATLIVRMYRSDLADEDDSGLSDIWWSASSMSVAGARRAEGLCPRGQRNAQAM